MTPKQKQLLDFLKSYIDAYGHSPSYQQMMDGIGAKSKSQIHGLVSRLESQGKIKRHPHRARTIELVAEDRALAFIAQKGLLREFIKFEAVA